MTPTLRPYQVAMARQALTLVEQDVSGILIELATGGGKTETGMGIIKTVTDMGLNVAWFAHRRELLGQASARASRFGISHGLIMPGHRHGADLLHIASIDTARARISELRPWLAGVDVAFFDEAHHVVADSWQAVANAAGNAVRIGLSATCFRQDGRGLGEDGLFTNVIRGPSIRTLIADGYLVPPEVYAPPATIDLSRVQRRGGDFVQGQLQRAVDTPELALLAARYYAKYSPGDPAVVFCAGVDHAHHVAEAFVRAGWSAVAIDGGMSTAERDAAIGGLAAGTIQVITSCDLISEGFDCPSIAAAILLRPTESTGLYLQQVGRVLRTYAGKASGLVVDLVGNIARHGMPDAPRPWTLDGGIKGLERDVPATRRCTTCYRVQEWADRCVGCGKAFPLKAPPARPAADLRGIKGFRNLDAVAIRELKLNLLTDLAQNVEHLEIIAKVRGYAPWWVHKVAAAKGWQKDRPASRFARRGGRW